MKIKCQWRLLRTAEKEIEIKACGPGFKLYKHNFKYKNRQNFKQF